MLKTVKVNVKTQSVTRITRCIISDQTNFTQCRLHLPIINLDVKILTISHNLFGNSLHWTIFLLWKYIPVRIQVWRWCSQDKDTCRGCTWCGNACSSSFCWRWPLVGEGFSERTYKIVGTQFCVTLSHPSFKTFTLLDTARIDHTDIKSKDFSSGNKTHLQSDEWLECVVS